jgi:hypothetical protein
LGLLEAPIRETAFDNAARTYERDHSGLIKKVNRPGGGATDYQLDKAGKVVRIDYPDKTWDKFIYDKNSQLLEAENNHVKVKFERNAAGQIIKEWQGDHWVASEYDDLGLRTEISSSLAPRYTPPVMPWARLPI